MSIRMKSHTERVREKIAKGQLTDQVVHQFVFRDPEIVQIVKDLREVFGKLFVRQYNVLGNDNTVIIPLVDVETLLGYLMSDLSSFIQGSGNSYSMARSFFETEVFERDEEIDKELYHGVLNEVVRLIEYLVRQLRTTDFDHHAPHTYDLVRILPSGGLLLVRASYRTGHFGY